MIHESDDEKEKERKEFYQTLVCDKKPYFFIYIYDTLKKEYNKVYKNENRRCLKMFGKSLDEILANPCSEEESKAKFYYEMVRNVDMSPSVMNKIAWYVEQEFKNFKLSNMGVEDCVASLKTDKPYKKSAYKKIANLYDEYLSIMRKSSASFKMRKSVGSEKVSERDLQLRLFKNKLYLICPNEEDLCNILLDICYENSQRSKYLAWQICGEQIINNLLEKNNRIVSYPVMVEEDGDFIYKGYSFKIFTKEVE